MKIVWLSHSGELSGGAQICVLEGARALADQGVAVHVVAPARGTLVRALEADGFPVTTALVPEWVHWWDPGARGPLRPFVSSSRLLRSSGPLGRAFRQIEPEVVVTNTLATAAGAVAARRARIPHVWYVHEFGREDHGMRYDFGERLSLAAVGRMSRLVLVNSQAVAAKLQAHHVAAPLRLVRYAVDVPELDAVDPPRDEPFRTVLVGRLSEAKGQTEAIRAVAAARQAGVPVELTIVGGELASVYGRELQALAQQLRVSEHVVFVGAVTDPQAYVAAAHTALMCSRNEAFGRVTVEAMKLGRPVIGARTGGTPELIRDGENGLLYTSGRPDELASRLEQLWRDPSGRDRLGRNAQEWATATFSRKLHGAALLDALSAAARA
jgi:glycosyltransferase involved in cell wall biosynthesis